MPQHPSQEHMDPVDNAWLRMESDTNLMMITGVWIFESAIDIDRLKQTLETRFLNYSRFIQKVVHENDKTYWTEDQHFDIDNHLHRVALPGAGDKEELQKLVSDLSSTPLDFKRPLWQMHLIEQYQGGCAMIIRIHHCVADGMALVRVVLSITDDTPNAQMAEDQEEQDHHHRDFLSQLTGPIKGIIHKAEKIGHAIAEEGKDLIQHPSHLLELAKEGLSIGSELTRIGLMPSDPQTCLKRPLSGRKTVAWANPIDLSEVKQLAKDLGGTINDTLLACATGALRNYLLENKDNFHDSDIHVAVPLNLRPLDKPITTLGNQFGLVVVPLPVGEGHPLQRFETVRKNMLQLKHSYQAQVFYGILGVLGKGPSILEQTALEVLSKKASAVMTNVPGPTSARYLAGSKLVQPMVWVPQSGEVGVGLSILSYNGTVQFGLVADKNLIPDPEKVVSHFSNAFNELKKLTNS